MKSSPSLRRLLAVLALGLAVRASGQTSSSVDYNLPQFQNVTVGRNVQFTAGGAMGIVQWQVSTNGGATFADLAESSVYVGTKTKTLEVVGADAGMANYQFRFTNTAGGVTNASSGSILTLSPLLVPMPAGIATDGSGTLYISDAANHAIYKGTIVPLDIRYPVVPQHLPLMVLAGKAGETGAADGSAAEARFNHPAGMSAGPAGLVTLADSANNTIRQVTAEGTVSTLAGSSTSRGSDDGAGGDARFSAPLGLARTIDGSYYVADSANHTIRKVAADGTVSTFAGSPGNAGFADGVGAAARFNHPAAVAVDDHGIVYVADTSNNLVRRITPAGAVTTLAGTPGLAGSQDGSAGYATFNAPAGIAVTHDGTYVYVADTGNSTIRIIFFQSPSYIVRTYVGVPTVSGMSDSYFGLLDHPTAIAVDASNDYYQNKLYIADTGNAAIRMYSWDNGLETITLGEGGPVNGMAAPSSVTTTGGGTSGSPPPSGASVPSVNTATASGSSGGGATDVEFIAALAGLLLLRRLCHARISALPPHRSR